MEFSKDLVNQTSANELKRIKEKVNEVYELDQQIKKLTNDFKSKKQELVFILKEAEVDKIQADECTASLKLKNKVSLPKEVMNKRKVFDFIKEKEGEEVLYDMLTINHGTFSSWYDNEYEQRLLEGNDEHLFNFIKPFETYSVGFRKRTRK